MFRINDDWYILLLNKTNTVLFRYLSLSVTNYSSIPNAGGPKLPSIYPEGLIMRLRTTGGQGSRSTSSKLPAASSNRVVILR